MAHQPDSNVIETVVQLLCESGLSQMAEAVRIMLNEAMKIERSQALGADPCQRSERRQGYANGFKSKIVETRLGPLALQVPQTRGFEFYPSALENLERPGSLFSGSKAAITSSGMKTVEVRLFPHSGETIGPGLLYKILRDCQLTANQFTELL